MQALPSLYGTFDIQIIAPVGWDGKRPWGIESD